MAIDFLMWFDGFWEAYKKRPDVKINNPQRRYKSIKKALSGCSCVEDIENYVCNLNTQKESTRQIMLSFFDYIRKIGGPSFEFDNLKRPIISDRTERRLEIAKYLHEPHSVYDIRTQFNIKERTCRDDLKALREGIEIMGAKICLDIEDNDQNQKECVTTLHPIFLPLNLTEVYALTVYLPEVLIRYNANRQIIMDILQRIKLQLSDYAYEKLYRSKKPKVISNDFNDYINDEMMARQRRHVIDYLAKSRNTCTFTWKGEEYKGRIVFASEGYKVQLVDGRLLDVDPQKIDFTINLDYR